MIDYTKGYAGQKAKNTSYDEGLRQYMLKIYNYMTLALIVTAVMAYASISFPPLMSLMYNMNAQGQIIGTTGMGMIISFAPLALVLFFSFKVHSMSVSAAQTLFWVFAGVMGMSLSYLGLVYTSQSLVKTLFITASVFGAMSIYGYTTKKDLTGIGSFLYMGLIGLILVSLVNIFMQSPAIEFATSFIGVGIFIGLTAYDTQKLKQMYYITGGGEAAQKAAVTGALTLYMDFINLFLYLLRFLGNRR